MTPQPPTDPTHRLYYHDANLREFTAEVVATRTPEGGEPTHMRLDQTAFYPTSGGQPHDTGSLDGVPVVDVFEDDNGIIWHVLSHPLAPGSRHVRGKIDWERRFDHMQQHTGQHLLSAAFEDSLGVPTIGFHLGSEASTIDLELSARGDMDWSQVFQVEMRVNQAIWGNHPITTSIMNEDEVAQVALRKPPTVSGTIRVIQIVGHDASACGGTHVAATGEIGIVKVTGLERYKGGVRVTFLAGKRALLHYQQHLHLLQTASLALSVGPDELPQAVGRMEESVKAARRELRQVRETLQSYESERMWMEAPVIGNTRVVAALLTERSFAEAKALAGSLRERPATLVLFGVAEDKGTRVVCARSDDLADLNAAAILREVLDTLNGRGGGTAILAQGGAPPLSDDQIQQALQGALQRNGLSY